MKILWLFLMLSCLTAGAQINPKNITIARDSFGVPHIFAPTDAEVAYGLAWAHAEDDFKTLQLVVLSGKAKLGTILGKDGAQADYVVKLFRYRQLVNDQWHTISPEFIALIKGYVEGLNAYAKAHPHEVKYKKTFPFNEREYLTAATFYLSIFCGIDKTLANLFGEKIATRPGFAAQGSNAFAFHPSRTATGEAFLAINAHQPQEGPSAFYEAHLQSEQGWNMMGGLTAGGCLIFHGTNENLGWALTTNYPDKIDVYQLHMNPLNSNQYKFNGEWTNLEVEKVKLNVKRIPIAFGKKVYWSKYGATIKTKQGVFSIRVPATMDCRAFEEWYWMNKAKNFTEFYRALSMTSIPMFNITYADRYDTIFYISNARLPRRNPDVQYNWQNILPGDTAATLWTQIKPVTELPQYINPESGYLFNTNHSPFLATDSAHNLNAKKFDRNDGFETYHNNRSQRVTELLKGFNKIDYTTFKKIKFDNQLPKQLKYPYGIDSLLNLNADDYPALKEIVSTLQRWDRKAAVNSKGAAVFLVAYIFLEKKLNGVAPRQLSKTEAVETYQYILNYMMKHFGNTNLSLGDIQKLVRGNTASAAWGLPDVLTAEFTAPYKNGLRKIISGDAYICFVRYPKNSLPIIESVNTFGASSHPGSPHYNDQQGMFLNQQTKPMTLDKQEVLRTAKRIYHPE